MKYILILLFISSPVFANDTKVLADAIAEYCEFNSEKTDDEKMECGERLTNCIIQMGGVWNDKDIFRCLKQNK